LPKDVKGHWDEVRRSALDCFNFWKVLQKLPELVEIEKERVKGISMWAELNRTRMYCKKARNKVHAEIEQGLQVCGNLATI
jgi:hypothetical protein